ncbi:sigma-70 family RNA polymerase sigma factor [Solibacillus merdavium]|uniref:Sigma-70 family RNA polymerase sigma factor n=1 Tax=Solibacillus merdavium TaxID=2762218 RepID=A0ABR8XT33_9BACL|nr:sigma-70 family RNA polymerase sigma factor [Solibacillus merdavium]MBD8035019.1 sigma-70 family RNA polymerase sigma factor [Solibacillus merdavium]
MDEQQLIKSAIAGNERAIVEMLESYEDGFYKIAFAYLKNEYDAVDAIQEMTYRCLKKIHTVKQPEYLQTWLIRILINICLDMKKKQARYVLKEEIEIPNEEVHPLELADVIAELPIEQQELIYLRFFKDLKMKDIARIQQVSEGTIKSRLHHTLRKLRGILIERGER